MSVWANRDFRLLWTSNAVSGAGSWLLVVAVPVHVFQLTGSAAATGLTLALEALPALLLGPWAGVLLDRWDLSRAMWIADLVSAAAVGLILFADRPERLWLIYLAVLVENVASTVFRPAARALLPAVVGTGRELAAANALTAFTGSVNRLAAPPLGALLLAGPGITFVLTVDIVSYLLSAATIAAIRRRPDRALRQALHPLEGLRYAVRSRPLRGLLTGNGIFLTANAGLTALLVPLTVERLDAPGHTVGYLISGLGVGYLVGAAVSVKALSWLGIRELIAATQLATAAAFFALANAPNVPWAIGAAVLIGLPGSVLLITTETTVQRVTRPTMLAQVGALFFAVDALATVIGAVVAPAAVLVAGLPLTLNLLAAVAVLAAPVTLLVLPGHPAELTRKPAPERFSR
ncbi:major facilitator superfamily MFS_1 [Kribbella flavida DSM 17836]|uniref:Major facilitator superfamily MFS_1 n=1 Tax=Kribbella flavida (strain DSM 17836 / JCM 10339 / NBRC 14399) TaxID=479435 RepID=D2PUG3_KRIFD|nr:MFS transporter [Kribbella flavida]ADB29481.1 major facilitator superfamily MFS_1 [Kribbella flavida DSM 17836]